MCRFLLIFFISNISLNSILAQSFIESKQETFKKLSISGNYRFHMQFRHFVNPYILDVNGMDTSTIVKNTLLIGDATQLHHQLKKYF